MKKVKSVSVVFCLFLVIAVFFLWSSFAKEAAAQAKTLKIGLISSVTGPMAPAFKSELDAAKPTAIFMNQRGGITVGGQKYQIEIVTADDQSSPAGAVAAANKVLQEGVKFIVAPMFMVTNMAIADTCEQAKALRMQPNSLEPSQFAPPNRYSFVAEATNINPPFVYEKLQKLYPHVKRIAILRPDDPGGKPITEATEKEIRRRGMEVVFKEAYRIPTEDFYPLLTKALAQKPDAIECVFSIIPWAKGIIEQSRELGFTGPITAVTAFGATDVLIHVLNPQYAYDICHANPDVTSPKMLPIVHEFGKVIEKETREKFSFDHLLTLRAVWTLMQGIEKAQSFDTDKVVEALENMSSVETPYGPGRFGGQDVIGIKRLMIGNIPFSRITKGGKVEFEFLSVK